MNDKFYIVSLGCPKNLTDSEVLMGHLSGEGYQYTEDPSAADIIVVNTCAFLSSARSESEQTIKEMSAYKKKGICKQLLVAGCLPKYLSRGRRLPAMKGVDGIIDSTRLYGCAVPRVKATPPWTAYIKISEGCNNNCAYCLIPSIRGRLRSRKAADVLKEVKGLSDRGVKEVIFVAQDTTAHPKFLEILKGTANIKGVRWIRIMYSHPKHITDKLIDVMAKEKKILKYIDLPMQHSSDRILKAMNRGYDRKYLEALILKLRKKMPGIAIRTTFIAGFPGETAKDFEDLKGFIEKMKLDRVGVFPFSREKGTKAYGMRGQLREALKRGRTEALMKLQEKVSRRKNKEFVGKTMDVLIEGSRLTTNGSQPQDVIRHPSSVIHYFGRTYRDAPEIDGRVFMKSGKNLKPGDITRSRILSAGVHDLVGVSA